MTFGDNNLIYPQEICKSSKYRNWYFSCKRGSETNSFWNRSAYL